MKIITPSTNDHHLHPLLIQSYGSLSTSLSISIDLPVPGGCLVVGDRNGDSWAARAPGSMWFDYVFGGLAEWFVFIDDRSPHNTD